LALAVGFLIALLRKRPGSTLLPHAATEAYT